MTQNEITKKHDQIISALDALIELSDRADVPDDRFRETINNLRTMNYVLNQESVEEQMIRTRG